MDEKKKYILEVEEDPTTIRLVKLKNGEDGLPSMQFMTVSPYKYDEAYQKGVHDTATEIEAIKDEAYKRGREDAIDAISSKEQSIADKAYQSGLSDAWEAARKISMAEINGRCSWKSMKNIFGIDIPSKIFKNFTASESIEKLKACEQEQGAEIKVGNEVKAFEKKPFIVTGFGYGYDEKDVYCYGFVTENGISTSAKKDSCVRTGRYFPEIAAIFEKMRERQK